MEKTLDIFNRIVNRLVEDELQQPMAEYIPSEDLFNRLDLQLTDEPIDDDMLEKSLEELVLASPRTATVAFFNQLFGGRNDKAVLGELLSTVLNNSMYTYKAAGPQIGVEQVILEKIIDLIGWGESAGGTFAPGGSMTNFMSMVMARDAADNSTKTAGVTSKMIVYTSKESHYSIPKNAAFSGIGRDQVRYIQTDDKGRMDPEHLKSEIEKDLAKGHTPTLVNLTAGTTVMGAFDPILSTCLFCKQHNIWVHVDGAYYGSVLFSKKYKHLLQGLELVDSFSVNAHKMIGTPLSCSIIIAKDKQYLYNSFSNDANYLYQTDHDDLNPGKISLQCGRRNDALKFWTLWKSVGSNGIEQIINHQFDLATTARNYINSNADYELYSFEDSISVCFNYKGLDPEKICTLLYEHSKLLVGYGTFRDVTFIRLVTINAQNTHQDIQNFFSTLESFVEEHTAFEMVPV